MKGYITRTVENRLEEALSSRLITMIIGPRQVGKSTLMQFAQNFLEKKQTAADTTKSLVFTRNIFNYILDDLQLRSSIKKDPRYLQKDIELSLGEPLESTQQNVCIFVDEVQKMPSLLEWIKQIFDKNSEHVKFILSGSSAISMAQSTSETLAGRVEYITVYPFVYRELLQAKTGAELSFFTDIIGHIDDIYGKSKGNGDADDIMAQFSENSASKKDSAKIIRDYFAEKLPQYHRKLNSGTKEATACVVETLFYGGLPRVMTSPIEERVRMIKNYIDVYMEKEIGTIARNLDLELFGLSLQSFATQNGTTLNINQVSKDVGISRPSLYKYLDLLENTYLVKKIHPYSSGGISEEATKSVVMYYLDTGVLNNLTYVTSMQEMLRPDTYARTVGTWLISTILSSFSMLPQDPKLFYWQDYAGHKLDLIFERGDISVAFMLSKPKDIRRVNSTIEKFAEISSKSTVVILMPYFDPVNMSLDYSIDEEKTADGKTIFMVKLPLQFLG